MPDVQIYENPAHMVNRLKAERAKLLAEREQTRAIMAQVLEALPLIGGDAGREIAEEVMRALPAFSEVRDPTAQGGYAPAQPAQLPASQQMPQQTQRALPAQAQAGGVVMPMLPDGFPIDAIPPEFREQARYANGQQAPQAQAPQVQQAPPQARPVPRFGGPRPNAAAPAAHREPIDVGYQQPGHPQATIQRQVGITDVIHDGSNGKNGNVKIGRLNVNGQDAAPATRASPQTPNKLSGLQAAVAKARAAQGGQ